MMFNRIWDQAGLPRRAGGQRPRPYDFRHHFAYANIERWMAEGIDVAAMLPYLSAYMGHATVESTYYYIHTSPDFMDAYAHITAEGELAAAGGRVRMKRDPETGAPNFFVFARDYLHTYMPTIRGCPRKRSRPTGSAWNASSPTSPSTSTSTARKVSFDHFDRAHLKAWLAWLTDDKHYAAQDYHAAAQRRQSVPGLRRRRGHHPRRAQPGGANPQGPRPPKKADRIPHRGPRHEPSLPLSPAGRAKSRRNRMLLILLYDTAARVSEITGLTLADLSLTKPGHVTLTGKRNKTRIVPLTDKTIEHLRVYLDEFHPNAAQHACDAAGVLQPARRAARRPVSRHRLGRAQASRRRPPARTAAPCPSNIHCHMLRKTKAMDLYQQGIPLPIIMRLLGHENTSTTAAFYAFATLDMMRAAVNAATPAIDVPADKPLTEDKLQALYSLR